AWLGISERYWGSKKSKLFAAPEERILTSVRPKRPSFFGFGCGFAEAVKVYEGVEAAGDCEFGPYVVVGPDTTFGHSVGLDANAWIGARNTFGNEVSVLEGAKIGNKNTISDKTRIGLLAILGHNNNLGQNVVVGNGSRVRSNCTFEDDAELDGGKIDDRAI